MAKPKKPNKRKARQAVEAKRAAPTRRNVMAMAPYLVAGVVVAGGLGFWGVSTVRADLAEQDLSIIGDGVPVIVQVHDPTCPICIDLQRETRAALAMMPDETIAYRVASLTSDVGSAFATRHGSAHATLLFFDAGGTLTRRLQGAQDRDVLLAAFTAHAGQ